MREDMHRKLIERGRWGSRWLKSASVKAERQALQRARATGDYDRLGGKMPMKPRRGHRRSPEETFGPLLAFLRSRVGRPWDRVYSEIRQNIDPSSVIDMHIMQHLFQFVRREVTIDDQKRVWIRAWQGPRELFDTGRSFFVHPTSRLLCRPKHSRPRGREVPREPHLILEDGGLGLRVDGAWFRVQTLDVFGEGTPPRWRRPVRDVVLKEDAGFHNARRRAALYGSPMLVGIRRWQLGRRELRWARRVEEA